MAQSMGGDVNLFVTSLAEAYLRIAQPEDVVNLFKVENYSGTVAGELSLTIAEAHLILGDRKQAEKAFAEAGGLQLLDPRPVLGRARVALSNGKRIRAEKLLKAALLLGSDS